MQHLRSYEAYKYLPAHLYLPSLNPSISSLYQTQTMLLKQLLPPLRPTVPWAAAGTSPWPDSWCRLSQPEAAWSSRLRRRTRWPLSRPGPGTISASPRALWTWRWERWKVRKVVKSLMGADMGGILENWEDGEIGQGQYQFDFVLQISVVIKRTIHGYALDTLYNAF